MKRRITDCFSDMGVAAEGGGAGARCCSSDMEDGGKTPVVDVGELALELPVEAAAVAASGAELTKFPENRRDGGGTEDADMMEMSFPD